MASAGSPAISAALSSRSLISSTFARRFSAAMRYAVMRPHWPRPGRRVSSPRCPPIAGARSTSRTRSAPRRASVSAHSMPAGPPPTTSASKPGRSCGTRSGCQPRRCSSPAVAFWVQPMWRRLSALEMQTLQPMHSRISSTRPSSILRGRNGSAIDGRAAPIRSQTPLRMISAMRSGSVSRPTPTIGFAVASRTRAVRSSCQPSAKKREGPESSDHSAIEPTLTSQRSTRSSARRTNSSPSSSSTPSAPMPSTATRQAIAQSSPTAARTASSVSIQKRARLASDPPYSSVRRL